MFVDGQWRTGLFPRHGASPEDLKDLARFQRAVDEWTAFRDADGRRAFTLPMTRCSEDERVKALDKLSAAQWLDDLGVRSKRGPLVRRIRVSG